MAQCHICGKKFRWRRPQGGTLGVWEYQSQSNDNANCVEPEDRFKWVDDLTLLEIINIISIWISSYNIKNHVPSDIKTHNQFIHEGNLKSQTYLEEINDWTLQHKMALNEKKTKNMIFNFTEKFQFSIRPNLNGKNIDVVQKTKLLGTIVTNDLNCEENTASCVKKKTWKNATIKKSCMFNRPGVARAVL